MFKKNLLALCIVCTSVSSYAYVIGANLTVENKTDTAMLLSIYNPNGQDKSFQYIPAHWTMQIYLENGDHSRWLYQMSTAPFKLTGAEDGKLYMQGRVAYYVGGLGVMTEYSFLDSISAASGLKVDATYMCNSGSANTVYENKIVITGKPDNELQVTEFPNDVTCQGLKSSSMEKYGKKYYPVCFNGDRTTYVLKDMNSSCDKGCITEYIYSDYYLNELGGGEIRIKFHTVSAKDVDDVALQAELDKKASRLFCNTW